MTLLGIDGPPDLPTGTARRRAGRLSVPVLCVPPEPVERSWQQCAGTAADRAGGTPGTRRAAALLAALGLRDGPAGATAS